jgi:outer membrane protein assembly factor BamB
MLRYPLLFALALAASAGFAADNWPQFRGPDGTGRSDSTGLPLTFGEGDHVKWKTAVHGKAWSCPVIWGSQIWVTTATPDGTELSAVCLDKDTGQILRDEVLFRIESPQFCHEFNSYASPTPVIEKGRVYVTFGSPGTACLDTATGKVLWERRDFVCNHYRGAGSSPILWGDLLIMNFDGSDFQFVVALDKKTGQTVWKTNRSIDYQDLDKDGKPTGDGDFRKAFSTPHVADVNGQPVLFSSGAKAHYAYDPRTGRELWRFEERGQHSASSRPILGDGLVFFTTGFSKSQLLAIKIPTSLTANDPPKILDQTQLAWRSIKGIPSKPSLLLDNGLLYMSDDSGMASCLDAKTGAELWRQRLGGNYSASPILADGRIYLCSEEGKVVVLAPSREYRLLAENHLDDGFMAGPAVSGHALFLRSRKNLYRIE